MGAPHHQGPRLRRLPPALRHRGCTRSAQEPGKRYADQRPIAAQCRRDHLASLENEKAHKGILMKAKPPTPGRDVPPLYRGIAAAAGKSRANAVKLFCLECVGYVRADVTNCTAQRCPLYRWRPYQDGQDDMEIPTHKQKQGVAGAESLKRWRNAPSARQSEIERNSDRR